MTETRNLSGREYAALQSLFAALSHLQVLLPTLDSRMHMIPGLYEDGQELERLTERVLETVLKTVPAKKLMQIQTELQHTRMTIRVVAPGLSEKVTGMSYIPTDIMNQLLAYVCEHECLMCDEDPVKARKCPIRIMIDGALPHQVNAKDSEHCKYSDFTIGIETEETA